MNRKHIYFVGIALTVFILIIHLLIINDYSINWDFHHVFFAGLYHLNLPNPPSLWHNLPFVDPDPRRMVETPFGPLQSSVPAATYYLFSEKLKILPFDSAWNLPAVIMGTAGILVLFLFLYEATNPVTALIGLVLLALYPRFWGDLHTNVKDITTAAVYTASIWYAWKMVNQRKITNIVLAALLVGITFNFKVNAIFIPVIIAVWVLWLLITKAKKNLHQPIHSWKNNVIAPIGGYFILSSLSAFGIWSLFWKDPYAHLAYLIRFFQYNTINMEVLLNGNWYCSGVNVPWYYPFYYLTIVTPLPTLIFFCIGIPVIVYRIFKKHDPFSSLVMIWFILPLVRFLVPNASVIDGIRHFEEVVFPLCAVAAIGAYSFFRIIQIRVTRAEGLPRRGPLVGFLGRRPVSGPVLMIILSIWLLYPIISYHPYQLSYFNELVGGIRGALGKFDIDYWGISQKRAVEWVNENAPPDSVVYIVMTGDTAGKYLRPDLRAHLNSTGWDAADYVVMLNRQSFFYRYFYSYEYMLFHKPIHTEQVDGTPLTWVFDNKLGVTARQKQWWKGEDPCLWKYW